MSVRFRVFASGRLAGEPNRPANEFYDLYSVPIGKSAIVNAMRFVNTHTAPVPFTIALRRRDLTCTGGLTSAIFPDIDNWPLGRWQCAIEDREVTLGPGEGLCAKVGIPNTIDFVISGVERDA